MMLLLTEAYTSHCCAEFYTQMVCIYLVLVEIIIIIACPSISVYMYIQHLLTQPKQNLMR